jgi:hypothetical protein
MPDLEYTILPVRKRVIKVTITNNQSSATASPHVQPIIIRHSYLLSLLSLGIDPYTVPLNTIFWDPQANAQAYSYYDFFDGIYHYWFVKTPSIGPNSTYTLYMIISLMEQLIDGIYAGINPYTGMAYYGFSYAQYDNGANVFPTYFNFKGTSAPSGINTYVSQGSVTFNNGVTIKGGTSASGGENGIATALSFSPPIVAEYFGTQTTSPSGDSWGWNMVGFSNYLSASYAHPAGGGTYTLINFENGVNAMPKTSQGGSVFNGVLGMPYGNIFPPSLWTHVYLSSAYYTYQNLQNSTGYITGANNTASLPFEIQVGNNEASYAPGGMTVYVLRTRDIFANGALPTVSFVSMV